MRKRNFSETALCIILVLSVFSAGLHAEPADPAISIIIDDIGYRHHDDIRALDLPGPVAYAIMPHSPLGKRMSELATSSGKDVILHLPMEAIEDEKNRFLGPGALWLEMNQIQFMTTLNNGAGSVPNIIGVNNHMGSLLTMDRGRMEWLMDYLHTRNIFYIDSVTSRYTVAHTAASNKNVPYLKRDIFLDNSRDKKDIVSQFETLIKIAKRRGKAIAIGHPHPETIEVLELTLPRLDEYGVRLIGLGEMVKLTEREGLRKVSIH